MYCIPGFQGSKPKLINQEAKQSIIDITNSKLMTEQNQINNFREELTCNSRLRSNSARYERKSCLATAEPRGSNRTLSDSPKPN
jgi:hypothetical protein